MSPLRLPLLLVVLGPAALLVEAVNPGGFPNGITQPIRGWRSWNAVFSDVTQSFIERQIEGISARRLTVGGKKTSLCDLGFCRVGIDSGWAECSGVNGSWHDETGHFIINRTSFPDMKAMVDYGHSKGVLMGFYLNQDLDPGYHMCKSEGSIPGAACNTGNCASYKNDAEDTAKLGFDGVKFDAGGGNDNMTLWAEAINATGRVMMLENCNDGGDVPYKGDEGCPFNMFRTGIDNSPSPLSMISNLLDVSRYLNVSRPGCWAYPDMLELGAPVVGAYAATSPRDGPNSPPRKSTCGPDDGTKGDTAPRLTLEQGKAELAAWCTVSAPLILGFDLANETEYDKWFPLLSNPRALSVQSEWAGLAGELVAQSNESVTTIIPHGASCEDMKDTHALPAWTVWGKPLPGGRYALTAINTMEDEPVEISIDLRKLGGLHMPRAAGSSSGGGEGGAASEAEVGAVVETEVWSGAKRDINGQVWTASLPKGAGEHRFVILGPRKRV